MSNRQTKAFSVVEYVILFVIVVGGFYIMKPYIQRGFFGIWQQTGQSFAFGRQYDSQKTIECAFDERANVWYDRYCAQGQCASGNVSCIESYVGSCQTSSCSQAGN